MPEISEQVKMPVVTREKEVITKEIVMIKCDYCDALMPQTATFCPNCGAKRK
jgi:ribosomal protein L40E